MDHVEIPKIVPAGSAHVGLDKTASEHNTGNDNLFLDNRIRKQDLKRYILYRSFLVSDKCLNEQFESHIIKIVCDKNVYFITQRSFILVINE